MHCRQISFIGSPWHRIGAGSVGIDGSWPLRSLPVLELVDELIEGLEGTHKGGVRFPIPSFVRYSGEFPPSYRKLDEIWAEKKIAE